MTRPQRRRAYTFVGIAVATAVATAFWFLRVNGNRGEIDRPLQPDAIWSSYDPGRPAGGLTINYPFDEVVFPPRIIAPTFLWEDSSQESDSWLVHVQMPDDAEAICVESPEQQWKPSEEQWATIQQRSASCPTEVTVLGVARSRPRPIVSSASISISTCPDEIGAPIFYREVNLPFRDAVIPSSGGEARRLRCNLGTIEAMKGRIDQATRLYREALESDPDNFEAHYSLGAQLTNMGRTGEAIPYLKEAVRLNPDSMPAIYYLGLAYQSKAEHEQAITHYMKVLEADPDFAPALTQLAIIRAACPQKELRDKDAAVAMAERACRLTDFSQPEILATLARVYAAVGRHSEAITVSQRAMMIARNSGQNDLARQIEREFQQDWRQPSLPGAELE